MVSSLNRIIKSLLTWGKDSFHKQKISVSKESCKLNGLACTHRDRDRDRNRDRDRDRNRDRDRETDR